MPFDAVFLHAVTDEINTVCSGARVEKIYQPERDEIMFYLHTKGGSARLLISASVNSPRIQIMGFTRENPAVAPMFCMLLRKHLTGARIESVEQLSFERVVKLNFSALDEFGETCRKSLVLEVLGRQTNIVLLDSDGVIIDCLKRTDISENLPRQMFSGIKYELPDSCGKLNPLTSAGEIYDKIVNSAQHAKPEKFVMSTVMGISPLLGRELVFRARIDPETDVFDLAATERKRLADTVGEFIGKVKNNSLTPYLQAFEDDKYKDFTALEILQYGEKCRNIIEESFSNLLDVFYEKKERIERIRNRSAQLTKFCQNTVSKLQKKIAYQQDELKASRDREKFRLYGELLTANLSSVPKGADCVSLPNYYEEGMPLVDIPLDPQFGAAKNAQNFFKKYSKLKTAETVLSEQIEKAGAEKNYLESVLDHLSRCENEAEIAEIRAELIDGGYIRKNGKDRRAAKQVSKPVEYEVFGGFKLLVGRNNTQNDIISTKLARKEDLWFHVLGATGSHALLITEGKEVPDKTVTQCAEVAAFYSSARMSSNVGVTVTQAKNLRKPAGSKPGFITYSTSRTVYVTPDEKRISQMKKGL